MCIRDRDQAERVMRRVVEYDGRAVGKTQEQRRVRRGRDQGVGVHLTLAALRRANQHHLRPMHLVGAGQRVGWHTQGPAQPAAGLVWPRRVLPPRAGRVAVALEGGGAPGLGTKEEPQLDLALHEG